jgi:flagellar motor switch protein FliG
MAGPAAVREALTKEVSEVLDGRVDKRLYMVTAKVADDGKSQANKMPFTDVDLSDGLLQRLFDKGSKALLPTDLTFELTVVFDTTVPQPIVQTLEKALVERFEVDNQKRKLTVRQERIFAAESAVAPTSETEKAKQEAELERVRLETERIKTEMERKQQEMQKRYDELELRSKTEKAELEQKTASPALVTLRELQVLIVGVVGFLVVTVGVFLGGMAFRQGMSSIGKGIGDVGKSVVEAVNAKVADDAKAREDLKPKAEEDTGGEAPTQAALEQEQLAQNGWAAGQPEFEDYIERIQEKVQILGQSRNYAVTRELTDMIDDDAKLPLAAAILLAVPQDTAKQMVQDLSAQQLQRLRTAMERPGGLAAAKALRRTALQEFFGRIAMAEFSDSPLLSITNATWLTRLTSAELSEVALSLGAAQRPVFFACLTPQRVKKLLVATADAEAKKQLIRAVGQITQVTADAIRAFIDEASNSPAIQEKLKGMQVMTDGGEYFGALAEDLGEDEQQILIDAARNNPELQRRLSSLFLPFSAVQRVPKELLQDMLQSRSGAQIASILFAAPQPVRDHVMTALPSIKADAVKDELKVMDGQPQLAPKHRKASLKVQKEIVRLVQRLVSDGLVVIDAKAGGGSGPLNVAKAPAPETAKLGGAA